jgi:hypothetical protein
MAITPSPDVSALSAALKVLADVINDATNPSGAGVIAYANALPDLMTLLPQIGSLGAEAKALPAADYSNLVTTFASYLNLGTGKAEAVLQSAVKLIADLQPVVTDIEALVAATK